MEKGGIAESQISASSVHYGILGLQRWGPELARLNNKGLVNAWTAASYDKSPWIEVRCLPPEYPHLEGVGVGGAAEEPLGGIIPLSFSVICF